MVWLPILKQLYNLSDESIGKRWAANSYHQFLCGWTVLQSEFLRHYSDLAYFRKRISKHGVTMMRFHNHPKTRKKSFAVTRKLTSIAESLLTERERKLPTTIHRRVPKAYCSTFIHLQIEVDEGGFL
jgi:hypothetical protein